MTANRAELVSKRGPEVARTYSKTAGVSREEARSSQKEQNKPVIKEQQNMIGEEAISSEARQQTETPSDTAAGQSGCSASRR